MELLHERPNTSSFISIAAHQSSTPTSFYTGPPVLHYHSEQCKILIPARDLASSPALSSLDYQDAEPASATNGSTANGDNHQPEPSEDPEAKKVIDQVEVWVTSDTLLLYSSPAGAGVSIPYPSISLHGIESLPLHSPVGEREVLFMHLISLPVQDDTLDEDDEPDSITLSIVPPASTTTPAAVPNLDSSEDAQTLNSQSPVREFFAALSHCSNFHPDPVSPMDEEDLQESVLFQAGMLRPGNTNGGLPPALPGSGGWITAENVDEYFDDDGRWLGAHDDHDDLGPGAGAVRSRNSSDGDGDGDGDAEDEESRENTLKWRRTS